MSTISDIELDDLHLQVAWHRPALCGAKASQAFRTTMYDFADCKKCIAIADQMMAEDERNEVMVRSRRSQYNGRIGHVVERDEEGGFEVNLPGVARLLHFEASEIEFRAAVAR
jgi:hypothetical protein